MLDFDLLSLGLRISSFIALIFAILSLTSYFTLLALATIYSEKMGTIGEIRCLVLLLEAINGDTYSV